MQNKKQEPEQYFVAVPVSELPPTNIIDTYHCNIRLKGTDEAVFPQAITFSGEWEVSKDYEVVSWLKPLVSECAECEGTGKVLYSCCGDDVKGTEHEDYGICPTCKEHISTDHEDCENCDGNGVLPLSLAQRDKEVAEKAWEACLRRRLFDIGADGNPIPDKETYLQSFCI